MINEPVTSDRPPASLLRRVGAMVSDLLVVVGLMLLGTLMFVPVLNHLGAKAMTPSEAGWFWSVIYWSWLLCIWMLFFVFFWSRSGQTVGMRAWRLRVEGESGRLLTWPQAVTRLWAGTIPWLPGLLAMGIAEQLGSGMLKYVGQGLFLLGVSGFMSMCLDPLRRTWHDRITHSRVILLPKL